VSGSPSASLSEINARQSLVAFFYTRPHFRADLVRTLDDVEDIGRLSQKLLLGRGDINDLIALSKTIHVWSYIKSRIKQEKRLEMSERSDFKDVDWCSVDALMSRMSPLDDLANKILNAIEEDSSPEATRSIEEQDDALSVTAGSETPELCMNETSRFCTGKWAIKQRFACR
jgi:DNA mismatch repair ATPase MutS